MHFVEEDAEVSICSSDLTSDFSATFILRSFWKQHIDHVLCMVF